MTAPPEHRTLTDFATPAEIAKAARELRLARAALGTQIGEATAKAKAFLPGYRSGRIGSWDDAYQVLGHDQRAAVDVAEQLRELREHLNRVLAKVLTGRVPGADECERLGSEIALPALLAIVGRIERSRANV